MNKRSEYEEASMNKRIHTQESGQIFATVAAVIKLEIKFSTSETTVEIKGMN